MIRWARLSWSAVIMRRLSGFADRRRITIRAGIREGKSLLGARRGYGNSEIGVQSPGRRATRGSGSMPSPSVDSSWPDASNAKRHDQRILGGGVGRGGGLARVEAGEAAVPRGAGGGGGRR